MSGPEPFRQFVADLNGEPSPGKVFPCQPRGKAPLIEGGIHAASDDPVQLAAWAEQHPHANVGLDPDSMGLGVVDLDGAAGEEAWADWQLTHGLVPETYTVRTPHGRHLYFKGRLPTTAGKLGSHIDTRGSGTGYVLIPPSVTADGEYREGPGAEVMDAPTFLLAGLTAAKHAPVAGTGDVEPDQPQNVARLAVYLDRLPVVPEGQRNRAAYEAACVAHDQGVSEETAVGLIRDRLRCDPPLDGAEIELATGSAYRTAQNGFGCYAVGANAPEWEEVARKAAEHLEEPADRSEWAARIARFTGRSILAYRDQPALEYLDADRLLPKAFGGMGGLVIGASGQGKTTVTLALIGEAFNRHARTLYCAGEGAFGLGKQRFPALAESLGVTLDALDERLRLVDEAVNLLDPQDVAALIEANREFDPDLVVIDTLAASAPGADENSASTASLMTGGGAVGQIKRAFNATVLLLHHTGKDESKGARGSSGFEGNADFLLRLTADKEAGTAKLHVRKMRDGPDGFDVHYRVGPAANGVPVARRIEPGEYKALTAATRSPLRSDVGRALRKLGAVGQENAVATPALAQQLVHEKAQAQPDKFATPQQQDKAEAAAARKLTDHLKPKDGRPGDLLAYVICDAWGEPVKPYLWALPEPEDDDE